MTDKETASKERILPVGPAGGAQKFGWGVLVATGLIWLGIGCIFFIPLDAVFMNGSPSAYSPQALTDLGNSGRLVGVFLMQGGLLLVAMGFGPFRAGSKSALYGVATVPVMGALASYVGYLEHGGLSGEVVFGIITFALLPLFGLLLSVGSFFLAKR